jgi:hypothetical protein
MEKTMINFPCSHVGCKQDAERWIGLPVCEKHYLLCSLCDEVLCYSSPSGNLCKQHYAQAKAMNIPIGQAFRRMIEYQEKQN